MARRPPDDAKNGGSDPAGLFDDDRSGLFDDDWAAQMPKRAPPPLPRGGGVHPPQNPQRKIAADESTRIAASPLAAFTPQAEARPNARGPQPDESTRIISVNDARDMTPALGPDATRIVSIPDARAMRPLADDATRIVSSPDATRISVQMPALRPSPSPSPQGRAAPKKPVQPIARRLAAAGPSNEASTRIVQLSDVVPPPAWRPAAVPRASSQPDTLAWEGEGTVARVAEAAAAALRALTGGKGARKEKAVHVERKATGGRIHPRELPFLAGVPDATLEQALASGAMAVIEAGRDVLIDAESAAFLVVEGQVALAQFPREKLDAERKAQAAVDPKDKKAAKKEAKRRLEVGPLIRLAEQNVAFFEKGDLVHLRDQGAPPGLALGAYSVTPVTGVTIERGLLEQLQRSFGFFADRVRRASTAARGRIEAVGGARSEVADFFIRHGLSVSQVLRVRAIDMCIECKQCEIACEERYGAKRLSLGGRVLGTLDFVDACHTCTDQRCIDPCAFDAIKYDVEKKEIVIIEAACTGCTLCATACPYAAIEMHDFDDKPLLKLRLEKQGKLVFGDGVAPIQTQFGPIKARKAKAKRIASKCDHCIDYQDQACISACPTGALVDVEPGDVFAARSEAIAAQADDGYDHSRIVDVSMLNDPRIFQQGLSSREAQDMDKARSVKPRIRTGWMWLLGLGAFFCAVVEILLRKYAPQYSADFLYQTMVDGLDKDLALSRVDYHAGGAFAVRLGYVGSVIMFSGMLYPLRRRVSLFKNLGSQRAWFDVHVMTGVIGPLLVSLHTANKLDNWITLAVIAMALTSLSGLAGRYLFTQLPEWASAAGLHARDMVGRLDALRPRHPGVRALDNWFGAEQKRIAAVAEKAPVRVLLWLFVDALRRLALRGDLKARVAGIVDPAARREAVRAALGRAKYERHKLLLPKIEPLFRRWKLVHVPAAILLTVLGGAHIVLALIG